MSYILEVAVGGAWKPIHAPNGGRPYTFNTRPEADNFLDNIVSYHFKSVPDTVIRHLVRVSEVMIYDIRHSPRVIRFIRARDNSIAWEDTA